MIDDIPTENRKKPLGTLVTAQLAGFDFCRGNLFCCFKPSPLRVQYRFLVVLRCAHSELSTITSGVQRSFYTYRLVLMVAGNIGLANIIDKKAPIYLGQIGFGSTIDRLFCFL